MTIAGSPDVLLAVLAELRARVAAARLPLELTGIEQARRLQREITGQLDYVLPRLRQPDAPLLIVIGGSTGAGKSTLVNSLVGRAVSPAGVLRPTTRYPVLVHHPEDARWFIDERILPGLSRTSNAGPGVGALRLVASTAVPRGLALLDAPDVDSVVATNRELAVQLFAAADLWIFATSAARYADAVPWELLRLAQGRGVALAVVLNRTPPEADETVTAHLAGMLAERGFGGSVMFALPETRLIDGLLPPEAITPMGAWLRALSANAQERSAIVRRTLEGALGNLRARVSRLADALAAQVAAAETLRRDVESTYTAALTWVDEAMRDGSLVRGEVLARWQEFVATDELLRSLESQIGRLRNRVEATVRGRPQPGAELHVAFETGVAALVQSNADRAAERVSESWRAHPAGVALLARTEEDLSRASAGLPGRLKDVVRAWQWHLLDLVREQSAVERNTESQLSFGVNGLGLMLMMVVFAKPGGLDTTEAGAEASAEASATPPGISQSGTVQPGTVQPETTTDTTLLSQKLLEAVFGDQAVRGLAARAREDLLRRVTQLLKAEAGRFATLLDEVQVQPDDAPELLEAQSAVQKAQVKPA